MLRRLIREYVRASLKETYGAAASGTDRDMKGPYDYEIKHGDGTDIQAQDVRGKGNPMRPEDPETYIRGDTNVGTFTRPTDANKYVGFTPPTHDEQEGEDSTEDVAIEGGIEDEEEGQEQVEENDDPDDVDEVSPGGAHTLGGW
jgi:hypothetical protein